MNIDKRIKKKKTELLQIYEDLPEKELKVASDLIAQAAFMAVTLEDLADSMAENGTVEEYTNGANQSGRKISSDAKLYASLIAKYATITDKLLKLIPSLEDDSLPDKDPHPAIIRNEKLAKYLDDQRARDEAFMEAVKKGEVKQIEYREFCKKWEDNYQ